MDDLNKSIAATYDRENRGTPRLNARYIITLTPPITTTSIIHDNACGPAVVTSEILSGRSSNAIPSKIEATDISPPMISVTKSIIEANNWNFVTAAIMDSQNLSFENDTFSHSFTNFIIPCTPGVRSEVYRTLKPGGTAVFTEWKFHGFVDVMRRCTMVIRAEAPPSRLTTEDQLKAQFETAGFGKEDIQVQSHGEDLPFENLDDLLDLVYGPFGKFLTKEWSAEELGRLPEVVEQVLTADERDKKSLDMVAWVVIATKA